MSDLNTSNNASSGANVITSFNYNPDKFDGKVRVRFAPSPTGKLHIGGVRTAIYNWAFARHNGGTFILRIDDTDPTRSTQENTQAILDAMEWLGIDWDEGAKVGGDAGPYFQTERFDLYRAALEKMKADNTVYPCFCTADELAQKREANQKTAGYTGYDRTCRDIDPLEAKRRIEAGEPHTWRIKVPLDRGDIEFDDAIYGKCHFKSDVIDDFVVMRSDGTPTYNFTTVIDDMLMGITHVIRGDDHLSNTPRQIMVYEALGAKVPTFAHLSMILGPDGKRLSKRHGATSVQAFRDEGYLPEAMLNYLTLLGWSLDGETTIFDTQTLFDNFTLDRINKSAAVFDTAKLDWINSVYIKEMGASRFIEVATPWLEQAGLATKDQIESNQKWFEDIYPLVAERVKKLTELAPMVAFLFSGDTVELEEKSVDKILKKEEAPAILDALIEAFGDSFSLPWTHDSIEATLRAIPEKLEIKPKKVFQVARVAITGAQVSPPLFGSMELLTRENCIARLQAAKQIAG